MRPLCLAETICQRIRRLRSAPPAVGSVLLLSLCLLFPAVGRAAVYHVSGSGNDTGDGSAQHPWRSLQKAADTLRPGDIALVLDGTYAGFHTTMSGEGGTPITFRTDGENVIINDRNADTPDGINIEGHSWITIDGFTIRDIPRIGIRVVDASDVIIRNNTITGCGVDGILTGYAVRPQITDNVCANSTREHGIYVSNSYGAGDDPVIRGNRCYGNGRSGIQLNGDCNSGGDGYIDNAVIEGNYIYDNKTKGISLISARNFLLKNNVIFNNRAGAAGVHLTDEPDCGNPSIGIIVNNTIVESRIAAIRITDASVNNRIFNNVLVGPEWGKIVADEVGGSDVDKKSNVMRTSPDGLFKDPSKRNFHLIARSPARGTGVIEYKGTPAPTVDREGRTRAVRGMIDAGAFEDNETGRVSATTPVLAQTSNLHSDIVTDAVVNYADGGSAPSQAAAIRAGHPRLWLTPQRLERLRRKACLDINGNPIPGCQTDRDWRSVVGSLPGGYWGEVEWHHALAYVVTGDVSYANEAIAAIDQRVVTIDDSEDRGQGNFLRIAETMRSVALVYDWCYDMLTDTQKTNYRNYMNQLLQELWNPFNNPTHQWNGWAVEDPGNNFYYSFMLGTAYAGIVLYGENPNPPPLSWRGTSYDNILDFLFARIETQVIAEQLNVWATGGYWHEGNNYGLLSKRYMTEMFIILRDAGGPNYLLQTDFVKDALMYHLYSMTPDFSMGFPCGDITRGTLPYDIHFLMLVTNALEGTREAEYAQYFINHIESAEEPWSWWDFIHPAGVLARIPDHPERDWRPDLPPSYYAEGGGWINSRSGWGQNDVSVSFTCTNRIADHESQDMAAFMIFKNGWQATNGNMHSSYGIYQVADAFNTLLINDYPCQAYAVNWDNIPEKVRDMGFVKKFEAGDDYTYVVGDASDCYYTNSGQFGNGNRRVLDIFTRELVHAMPGYVIVYDRVTSRTPTDVPVYQLQTDNQPTQNGNRIDATANGGRLYNWTLLPESNRVRIRQHPGGTWGGDAQSISSYQTWIDPTTPLANNLLLNVIYVTDNGDNIVPGISKVSAQGGNMVGAKIEESGGENVVIMFSTDPSVDVPVTSVIYDVGLNLRSKHLLFGFVPDSGYDVEVATTDTGYNVSVSPGSEFRSSDAGTLRFELQGQGHGALVIAR